MIKSRNLFGFILIIFITCFNCGKDESNQTALTEGNLRVTADDDLQTNGMSFVYTENNTISDSQSFTVTGESLSSEITISVVDGFELSTNNTDFSNNLIIKSNNSNNSNTIYIRFSPNNNQTGNITGKVTLSNAEVDDFIFYVTGKTGTGIINYVTFNKERLAYGGGYKQTSRKSFTLHPDVTNIETIKMYVKLTCPNEGCDEWDVFANVKVKDPISGEDYELARFITPYWNDNSQLDRGFEFDVTDFKSILTGNIELRIRTECWNAKGYEVTVDFDYIEGTPDFSYYEIARVLNYDNGSASGIPYGISHDKDVTRQITLPTNTKSTHLRTFINGWGEAIPSDEDGRRCAEWCYRTHQIKINNVITFDHYLGPLGCANNPVSNQSPGNWTPDRAGWCPGMIVPTRIDTFNNPMAGSTFDFEYTLEEWVNDETKDAYYPVSTFVIVKSNSPISRPIVVD